MIPSYRQGVEEHVKKSIDEFGKAEWKVELKIIDAQDKLEEAFTNKHSQFLQARTENIGIDEQLGKHRVVSLEGPKKDQSGFYCQLCDELATDSNSWLDHLNSKKHNRLLGMNMKVERTSLTDIQQKLESLKQTPKANAIIPPKPTFEEIKAQFELKQQKKQQKKQKKSQISKQEEVDDELQTFMQKKVKQ